MSKTLNERLKTIAFSDSSLRTVSEQLKELVKEGVDKRAIETGLNELRESASESDEDRILEILDLVTGFCGPDLRL